jgi:hypothetical protein
MGSLAMKNHASTAATTIWIAFALATVMLPASAHPDIEERRTNMKLEELVQKLDAASPWPVEKAEEVLGVKLTASPLSNAFISYEVGQLIFEEGLVIEEVELRVKIVTKETIRLILNLSDNASCFTRERLKKTYPNLQLDLSNPPRRDSPDAKTYYDTKRSWGHIAFGFKVKRPDCLAGITFIPTKWEWRP